MNRKIKFLLSAFIALSLAGLAVLVFIHYKSEDAYRVTFKEDKKVGVKIDRIHYSGSKDGRVEWELEADSAQRAKDADLTVFERVKVSFYPRKGPSYTLTSKEAVFRESTGEIAASGEVVVESTDGYRISAEKIQYSLKTKIITSGSRVGLKSSSVDVSGAGLNVDVEKGTIFLSKDVKAVFKGPEL